VDDSKKNFTGNQEPERIIKIRYGKAWENNKFNNRNDVGVQVVFGDNSTEKYREFRKEMSSLFIEQYNKYLKGLDQREVAEIDLKRAPFLHLSNGESTGLTQKDINGKYGASCAKEYIGCVTFDQTGLSLDDFLKLLVEEHGCSASIDNFTISGKYDGMAQQVMRAKIQNQMKEHAQTQQIAKESEELTF
jgi:hypothetical protein